jgi:hypothetical protein
LDSITALEALWGLQVELSFRLAFLTASLLGTTDDRRLLVFETLRQYYTIRSKIVHGTPLRNRESALVDNDTPLREIVQQSLRGFVHLLANPGPWTVKQLREKADAAFLHSEQRSAIQAAMDIHPE